MDSDTVGTPDAASQYKPPERPREKHSRLVRSARRAAQRLCLVQISVLVLFIALVKFRRLDLPLSIPVIAFTSATLLGVIGLAVTARIAVNHRLVPFYLVWIATKMAVFIAIALITWQFFAHRHRTENFVTFGVAYLLTLGIETISSEALLRRNNNSVNQNSST